MNTRLTTLAILLAVALPAGLSAQNFSTLSGSIVDQSGAALPGVMVVATNRTQGSRHEISTNRDGRFELLGLAQGSYRLEADLPGFASFRQDFTLTSDVTRDITLEIGSLEETITVVNDPDRAPAAPAERYAPRPANCGPFTGGDTRIGGQIRQPRKLLHVPPIYPQGSAPGIVRIAAVIGIDGLVKEATVTSDSPEALARAAVDAVQRWEFDPTLLNCQAVDVRMSVIVDFR